MNWDYLICFQWNRLPHVYEIWNLNDSMELFLILFHERFYGCSHKAYCFGYNWLSFYTLNRKKFQKYNQGFFNALIKCNKCLKINGEKGNVMCSKVYESKLFWQIFFKVSNVTCERNWLRKKLKLIENLWKWSFKNTI